MRTEWLISFCRLDIFRLRKPFFPPKPLKRASWELKMRKNSLKSWIILFSIRPEIFQDDFGRRLKSIIQMNFCSFVICIGKKTVWIPIKVLYWPINNHILLMSYSIQLFTVETKEKEQAANDDSFFDREENLAPFTEKQMAGLRERL